MSRGTSLVALSLWLLGCPSARFVREDPTFTAEAATRDPELFIYQSPDRPYRVVGIVEASHYEGLTDEALTALRHTGRAAGCELLVDRRIAKAQRTGVESPSLSIVLVHKGLAEASRRLASDPPDSHRYQFLCGLWRIPIQSEKL